MYRWNDIDNEYDLTHKTLDDILSLQELNPYTKLDTLPRSF